MAVIEIAKDDFWRIRHSPGVVEWHYLCDKLMKSVEVKEADDWIVNVHQDTGDYVYLLHKRRFTSDMVARTFGLTVEQVEKMDIITLKSPKARPDLPAPNVSYWGEA